MPSEDVRGAVDRLLATDMSASRVWKGANMMLFALASLPIGYPALRKFTVGIQISLRRS